MATTKTYTNLKTGQVIDTDAIYSVTEEGLFLYDSRTAAITFVSADDLKVTAADENLTDKLTPTPEYPDKTDTESVLNMETGDTVIGENYTYIFGFNNLQISRKAPDEVSGFITQEIKLGSCSYVELSADIDTTDIMPEFYIVEGNNEASILPAQQTTVENEQLSFALEPRFSVNTEEPVTVYKNNTITDYTLDDLENLDFGTDTYTISYTPLETAHKYYPDKDTIKIKIIQRALFNYLPGAINNIVILKYGGEKTWITSV